MIASALTSVSNQAAIGAALAERRCEALVIGASAGGVDALFALLPMLPAGYRLPVFCILHLPGDRDSRLAELFRGRLPVPVKEAADKEPIVPGTVYFAPSGYHLSVEQDLHFSLSCEPPVHFARPAIDVLMASSADAYGPGLVGILLTGANQDGAGGMAAIHDAGGLTVVQDPDDAQVPTMPRSAIELFRPHLILPLAGIGALLPMLETTLP